MISAAVNEASRRESLCKTLGSPLALSEAFTKAAEADGIVDLREHALKGVKAPLRVFTLERLLAEVRRTAQRRVGAGCVGVGAAVGVGFGAGPSATVLAIMYA